MSWEIDRITLNTISYMMPCIIVFICKVNICNFSSARALAFIYDSGTDVLEKVSKFFKHNVSTQEGRETQTCIHI